MDSKLPNVVLQLPDWAIEENLKLQNEGKSFTPDERVALTINFAHRNAMVHKTGGPFAAGVFEKESGRLVVMGVNRVMANNCSSAHAEVVCLSVAQQLLGSWDLSRTGLPALQLVVNWRPCCMCFGALLWSGCSSLLVAGDGPELEQVSTFATPFFDRHPSDLIFSLAILSTLHTYTHTHTYIYIYIYRSLALMKVQFQAVRVSGRMSCRLEESILASLPQTCA